MCLHDHDLPPPMGNESHLQTIQINWKQNDGEENPLGEADTTQLGRVTKV